MIIITILHITSEITTSVSNLSLRAAGDANNDNNNHNTHNLIIIMMVKY